MGSIKKFEDIFPVPTCSWRFVFQAKDAKKIAKDMERWAKSMNQRKEATKTPVTKEAISVSGSNRSSSSGAEDIAFSMMLNKKSTQSKPGSSGLAGLASYGSDSEEETGIGSGAGNSKPTDETQHSDWNKLACLLCKRQFPTKEKLEK